MTLGVYFFSKIMLTEEKIISNSKLIILLSVISIIHYIINANIFGLFKTIIICCINISFYKCIYNIKVSKCIFVTFLYMIILILTELLELFFITKILGISKYLCYDSYAGSLISNIFVCILFLIMTFLIKNTYRNLIKEKVDNNNAITIYIVLIFICIGMFFYMIINEFKLNSNVTFYLLAIILLITLIFSLINKTISNNRIINEYDNLLKIMTTYENDIENERILRHEAKNELRTIRAKIIDNQKNKEIIEYIDEIVNDKYEINNEKYAKFGYLPPNGIKGLCYFKTQEAEKRGVNVSVNISKRVIKSTIYNLDVKQQRDFGRILGVFLDNAIEASVDSNEKKIGIEAYINNNGEFSIIISNSYRNIIDNSKIGIERFSTKGNNRGRGLLLVKRITEKSKKIETKNDSYNNIYIQTIIIKK